MPFYTYKCPNCGEEVTLLKPIAERDYAPACDCGFVMKRGLGGGNFVLKGGGWYRDGYSKGGQ